MHGLAQQLGASRKIQRYEGHEGTPLGLRRLVLHNAMRRFEFRDTVCTPSQRTRGKQVQCVASHKGKGAMKKLSDEGQELVAMTFKQGL